jgi:hypothetical protein
MDASTKIKECADSVKALSDAAAKVVSRVDAIAARRTSGYGSAGGMHDYLMSKGYEHRGTENRGQGPHGETKFHD